MFSNEINRKRDRLSLKAVQRQIIVGSMLGDGYLYPTVSKKYAYFRIAHGPKQKDYVWWKYNYFKDWVLSFPRYQLQNKQKPDLGGYYWFKTIVHKELLEYREIFYKNRTKIIPNNIGDLLKTSLSLAVWYMDDGSINRSGINLNTQSFFYQENLLLQKTLRNNFQVDCNINKSGNIGKGYILYIPKEQAKKFMFLVKKYVKQCMLYKTFLTP